MKPILTGWTAFKLDFTVRLASDTCRAVMVNLAVEEY